MKKVLLTMMAVVALTITSCCNNKAKTCDKANTECVAAESCCKAACEMADSCKMDCAQMKAIQTSPECPYLTH